MKASQKTKQANVINKIYSAIKSAWSWFAILYIPLFSIIQMYIAVIPDDRALALVTNIVYLEIIYGLLFCFALICVRFYGKTTGIKIKPQKNENSSNISLWCFISIILSLLIIFTTAQIEKNKVKKEAGYYQVPVRDMGFVSDGLFGAVASNIDMADTQVVNVVASAFVPMTFGISLLVSGIYNSYRFSNFVQTQYSGSLLLIMDYKTKYGRLPHSNPWVHIAYR